MTSFFKIVPEFKLVKVVEKVYNEERIKEVEQLIKEVNEKINKTE